MTQEQPENKAIVIERKTKELYSLKHRLEKYWKKLLQESFRVARERGIKSEILDLENIGPEIFIDNSRTIPIYKNGKAVDADAFLKLASQTYPSLYRRYKQEKEQYERGLNELEKMLNQVG